MASPHPEHWAALQAGHLAGHAGLAPCCMWAAPDMRQGAGLRPRLAPYVPSWHAAIFKQQDNLVVNSACQRRASLLSRRLHHAIPWLCFPNKADRWSKLRVPELLILAMNNKQIFGAVFRLSSSCLVVRAAYSCKDESCWFRGEPQHC